ncbi:MAG: tripartite tricarboxylate transporter TctB family protein [Deltaproteobacteria bacterium]
MNRHEAIGGGVLFLFGAVTAVLSLRMSMGTFRNAGSGMFPFCLGILLMILSILFLLNLHLKGTKRSDQKTMGGEPVSVKQILLFFGTIVLATLFFNSLGYPLMSFLLLLALLRVLGMKRWPVILLLSFATAVVTYFLFVQWLKIPLPQGWIGI